MNRLPFFILCIGFSTLSVAMNKDHGKELHMEKCTGCHGSEIYMRENRRVKTLPKLGTQVRFCRDNLGITWFDDEVNDVIFYLNSDYYKFK